MKKYLIAALSLLLTSTAFAGDICPTPEQIKNNEFNGWVFLNSNSENPASNQQIDKFIKSVSAFYQAEYSEDFNNGNAHCYYRSKADVLLAKATQPFKENHVNWKNNGLNLICQSDAPKDCEF